jgi:hypothetical protein
MQFKFKSNRKLPFFVVMGLALIMTSCGSYQYVGYDDDGIYSSGSERGNEEIIVEQQPVTTSTDNNYFENYFQENKAQLDAITASQEDVFTDVDSYQSENQAVQQDTIADRVPYGGWGQTNENITINYIDNGWNWGLWNDPWMWGINSGWGWGTWNARFGWGWGWARPWNWGWGWNAGWGWGGFGPGWSWGWNAGWGWGYPGYGWGWGPAYGTDLAFVRGRRGSLLYNNNLGRIGRSNAAISRLGNSVSRRSYNSNYTNRRYSGQTIRSNTTRRNSSRVTRPNRSIRNSSSTPSRPNTRVTRPSRRSGSSGTIRRSGGSVRSSGGSRPSSSGRSSGGGRRGRG